MGISNIVDVQISRQTSSVSQAGFGTMMILGFGSGVIPLNEGLRYYANMDEVAVDFASSDEEYKSANIAFSQSPKPSRVAIGAAEALVQQNWTINFDTDPVATTQVTLIVNGINLNIGGGVNTVGNIETALNAVPGITDVVVDSFTSLEITFKSEIGVRTTVTGSIVSPVTPVVLTITETTPGYSVTDALDDIEFIQNDWYALTLANNNTYWPQYAAAQWISSRRKIFCLRSSEAGIKDVTTTDIAAAFKALNYDRTIVVAHYPSVDDFIDAGWLGRMLPEDPGSATYKFKTIAGCTADNLTSTEANNIKGKNANTYETVGGVAMMAEGVVSSGEYIDIITGVDWLQARIEERVFSKLVNLNKIPFTDAGVAIIENEIRAQLNEGVRVGLLAADPAFTVTVPKVADVSPADKAARYLPNITFVATLAGAVHKTQIRGTVSI
jgi:hypothetical protein